MKARQILVLFLLLTGTNTLFAQEQAVQSPPVRKTSANKKGSVFAYWGWNREVYTNSTLKIKGGDYDLTLHKLKATDRPSALRLNNYLRADRITIPQTNLRVGYYLRDDLAITAGFDHMKYVMVQNQTAKVDGIIQHEGKYQGTYNGNTVIYDDFLTFEHTDGLNYLNIEVEKLGDLYQTRDQKLHIGYLYGLGLGVMIPRTNTSLLDYERNDRFHVSGFGTTLKAGVQITVLRKLSFRFEAKAGYVDMPDIILHKKGIQGRGKQDFIYAQVNGMIGAVYSLH
ncbi:hypothetical protein DBR32_06995 [Taibaiella sp. KBW10]|uniref:hypothetical protein n=1 Tax=Taibaiella sp. KBW10 TaxID=2153357 RepID=UPI000F5A8383|nr:hypothetical protein [Taibaiella sp. KBW10]RQO31687.1 hypothetical protein DBR32_06995 [Taibaiella sp. KBW10]